MFKPKIKGLYSQEKQHFPNSMKPKNICTVEFPVDEFRRVIALPKAIINTEVKADYTNEILTLTLPKTPEAVNRVIKVNLMETHQPEQLEMAEV
ncbi:MAG: Hsp20/alpha crystallin family protein [Limnoraphis sp.]